MKRDYDVRLTFTSGFESMCVDGVADESEAVIKALKIVKNKAKRLGNHRTIKSIEVVPASHERYAALKDANERANG